MRLRTSLAVCSSALIALVLSGPILAQTATGDSTQTALSAKTWLGKEQEIEQFLKTAEIVRSEKISLGVTAPERIYFAPGGPAESAAWHDLAPGMHKGFWDSYKGDVAAYEVDKVLGLHMVPPTVERRYKDNLGSVSFWVPGTAMPGQPLGSTRMWKDIPPGQVPKGMDWDRQVMRMKMLDLLIANTDRNAGNLLIDQAGNLILIDHTRAFTTQNNFNNISKVSRVDAELWDKIKALNLDGLQAALGKILGKKEIESILKRRDKMQEEIDKLIKDKGDAAVMVR